MTMNRRDFVSTTATGLAAGLAPLGLDAKKFLPWKNFQIRQVRWKAQRRTPGKAQRPRIRRGRGFGPGYANRRSQRSPRRGRASHARCGLQQALESPLVLTQGGNPRSQPKRPRRRHAGVQGSRWNFRSSCSRQSRGQGRDSRVRLVALDRANPKMHSFVPGAQNPYPDRDGMEWFCLKPEQFRDYIDEIDSPWVQAYYDIGNMQKFAPSHEWIRILGKRAPSSSASRIGEKTGFCSLGKGDAEWGKVRNELEKIDFKGWATREGGDGGDDKTAKLMNELLGL